MRNHNHILASIFREMSACYKYLGKEHRFRTIAYERAARTMLSLKQDVSAFASDIDSLDKLNGIGESIAEKIMEFLKTGHIVTFEKLKSEVPTALLDIMEINGMGPATTRLLHEQLGIHNKEELVSAIETGKLSGLKGFGEKKIENIRKALKISKETGNRMLLHEALQAGESLLQKVISIRGVKKAELAGSLRRMKETVGDIDLIVATDPTDRKKIIRKITELEEVKSIIAAGETKASVMLHSPPVQADIRIVDTKEYGSALLYFTGSKEHNIQLRTMAREKNWKINEYGLFENKTGSRLCGETETDIYERLGMPFIVPEMREDKGEIQLALNGRLPALVHISDIRGDMQMHSNWSDGSSDIEGIARHVLKHFPAYDYIVMTDHSPSSRIAGGLSPQDFIKQFKEIDRINDKIGRRFIKKGVEVDILPDGSLDLDYNLLEAFEWVTASIHSGFTSDNTERLISACDHPLVDCIGHPSGRLIGKRNPYPLDWNALFQKASEKNTVIEINAQPQRLDIHDDVVRDAVISGVMMSISTDAHDLSQFDFMRLGIGVARRGWCGKENILNTKSWADICNFRKSRREKNHDPIN